MGEKKQKVDREFSAGGVVFKREKGEILWLISRSTPSKLYPEIVWRLQKGWIDDESETMPGPISRGEKRASEKELQETSLREVKEEGGVKAKIIKKIGTRKYFMNSTRGRVLKFVTYYLMEWIKDLPEGFDFETSEIAWLPFEEAYKRLTYGGEKQILKKAGEML